MKLLKILRRADASRPRASAPRRGDLHEARPLLQAIFLGIALATALVAAAAVASPRTGAHGVNPALTYAPSQAE